MKFLENEGKEISKSSYCFEDENEPWIPGRRDIPLET
jgi:hypothetical protein